MKEEHKCVCHFIWTTHTQTDFLIFADYQNLRAAFGRHQLEKFHSYGVSLCVRNEFILFHFGLVL
jgi:hypothetical protein